MSIFLPGLYKPEKKKPFIPPLLRNISVNFCCRLLSKFQCLNGCCFSLSLSLSLSISFLLFFLFFPCTSLTCGFFLQLESIPSTKFFLGSFCYCLFVSLFIYYFLNNGGWHAIWAGFGDDYQSTLFVSNDHSACNFPPCPSNGLRNHNFKVVASGYQCIKGQVFGFLALCLSNDKIVNQLITKKKKNEKEMEKM